MPTLLRGAVSGQIELMLHRRLLCDDNRGVAEPLNETQVCAHARAVFPRVCYVNERQQLGGESGATRQNERVRRFS